MALKARRNPRFGRASRYSPRIPQAPRSRPRRVPAPILGVNFYDSLATQQPGDAVYAFNVQASSYGLETRQGYRQHCTGLGGEVRTLIPFVDISSADRLFATTPEGIYNVTSVGAVGTIVQAFATTTGNAGYGNSIVYNNDNGDFFVIYADDVNGLYEYDVSAGTWAAKTDITGAVDDSDFLFITEHKNRIWLVERGSSSAYYLPVGAKGGAATEFNLGNKFIRGGALKGIYSWSVDGGDGIDDLLVFVSDAGDVAIYQGTDPSSASTWQSIGVWNVGQMPTSRNIAHNFGGELHLLSVFGLLSMQDLVQGVSIDKATGQNTIARKITRPIRDDMQTKIDSEVWDIVNCFSDNIIVIVRPYDTALGEVPTQYVFNFTTAGWTMWRDVPINCLVEWNGDIYFGDRDGVVHRMAESVDGADTDGENGSPIFFDFLCAYEDLGMPGMWKQCHTVRPTFYSLTGNLPDYSAFISYDYDLEQPTPGIFPTVFAAGAWDVGVWDTAEWGGAIAVESSALTSTGMGFVAGVGVFGQVIDRTTFLDAVVYFKPGGMTG